MAAVSYHRPDADTLTLGVGFSKCNATDTWNAIRGREMARGRAVVDLLDQMMAEEESHD
jgi:hypothetical protein